MGFFTCTYLFLYVFCVFLWSYAHGTCQCNQMLHPGVFSGEKMTFVSEENRNHDERSPNSRKQSFAMGAISFEPPYLDFSEQPVGMPYVRDVKVFNPSNEKNLQLQTLSGDNAHFHASFPKPKTLSPLSNTSIEVIFLARSLGNVENTLFIHTSLGAYPYQVRGFGVQNPYRLSPFLGAKIALDHTFSSVINMYNPHMSMLQVTEIYSSGGDLHLELPSGDEDASHKHWQIAPYESKPIIRFSFLGRVASNHTSFIRIHTNKFIGPKQFLILPLEVEVSTVPGLYASLAQLDFGTLRRMDEPKTIVISLMNTGSKPVTVTEVIVDPPNKAITVDIKTQLIKPSHQYVKAFAVTYSASNVKSSKQHFGKLVIKSTSKSTPRLEINYQVNVLQGTLAYSVSKTRFFVGSPPFEAVSRDIIITNTFTFPLVIHRVLVLASIQDSISIVNFSSPIVVQEQKTVTPFSIRFLANESMTTFSSSIRVYTNASIFTIPISCYDGKLQFRLAEPVLNFGTLAVTQKHYKMFEVANPNPVEVIIDMWVSNSSLANVVHLGNENDSNIIIIVNNSTQRFMIKPGRISKFRLEIVVPQLEGVYNGSISFNTTFEMRVILFSLKAASGRIEIDPAKIAFAPSFPGQVQKQTLFLTSTFINPVNVMSAMVKIEGKRFSFVPIKKSNAQLAPYNKQKIGDVVFDPSLLCSPKCYSGIKDREWFKSFTLPSDTATIDTTYLDLFQTKWNSITETGRNNFSSSIVIDTEAVKGVNASIEGGLVWPSLSADRPVRFPLTHVGNISRRTLTLSNSADVPVLVQIVPLSIYPDAQSIIDVLSDRFDVDLLTAKPSYHLCFSLPTAQRNSYNPNILLPEDGSSFMSQRGMQTSPNTVSLMIAPRSKVKIPVQFKPENEDQRTSVMLIRNNLTALDVITVQGQGARGELMINGKRPSVDSVLLFELKQRHLADCTKLGQGASGKSYRALTVKKTVVATNPGQLATQVTSFNIDGYECEGYGFKVLNCQALILKPTATIKIDITFTPDFSVSRVSRRLQIKTALGAVFEFSLIATIPSELIPLCAAAAGRPGWEFRAYISAIAVMTCLLVGVLVMAHYEANKLIAMNLCSLSQATANVLNGGPMNGELFDLRKITAPRQTDTFSGPKQEKNGVMGNRRPKRELGLATRNPPEFYRRNLDDVYENLVSNNNSICHETPANENHRVKSSEATVKELGKKNKKNNGSSQTGKRKDSDSENPKPVLHRAVLTQEVTLDKIFHPGADHTETATNLRDSSSSETNSIGSEVSTTKKDKSKMRKKTAKVAPAVVPGNTNVKIGNLDKGNSADKDKTKVKEKCAEQPKDKRSKNEGKEDVRKPDTKKTQTDKTKPRRPSLPVELENTTSKVKEDKSRPASASSSQGKSSNSSKKSQVTRMNSLGSSRPRKHTNDSTPSTISEVINSALEATLKSSPTTEAAHQKSRSHSRCSSVSPSPPPSDSSQGLSRSSSYSSVVGSEESISSENSNQRKKHSTKGKKPAPLNVTKHKENKAGAKTRLCCASDGTVCGGLVSRPWPEIVDRSLHKPKEGHGVELFSPVSTSLFASTPFDKDRKLESPVTIPPPYPAEERHGDKYPLYTFGDVKVPGMVTPFVDTDTSSVPKFWPDDPIPALEDLVPKKQKRNTNWVNFLDESSTGTTNLPSPGMPQSTKTVAEIWDSGQHDENDGWSAAFSPTFDSDLSPTSFPSFHQPTYEAAWSSAGQSEYYGTPAEHTWGAASTADCTDYGLYSGGQNNQSSSKVSYQLNPLSKPWEGGSAASNQTRWSPATSYHA